MRNSKTSQLVINAIQAGTKFTYSHTMSNNRTLAHYTTFAGTPTRYTLEEANELLRCCSENGFFIPEQVGLISLRNDLAIEDEVWHKLADKPLTEVIGHPLEAPHIDTFLDRFTQADWKTEASASYCALMTQYELENFSC